jgi:hypothetical protein
MGVVRREGDWRLEKRQESLYEITYQRDLEAMAVTPDYSQGMMDDLAVAAVPVHEVDSYAEAEGLFEEHAHGRTPDSLGVAGNTGGVGQSWTASGGGGDLTTTDESFDLENSLPPGGLAVVLAVVGGIVLSQTGFAPGEPTFLVGTAMTVIGVAIFAWAGVVFQSEGSAAALDFLVTVDQDGTNGRSDSENDEPETTPPTPEALKNELIFGRADQHCEWCDDGPLDNPEVHHIEPRNEGGPNERDNLMVLCPTCHAKADRGGISKTKLRGKMSHILDEDS